LRLTGGFTTPAFPDGTRVMRAGIVHSLGVANIIRLIPFRIVPRMMVVRHQINKHNQVFPMVFSIVTLRADSLFPQPW
jgi:hypothetical protein